MVGILGNEYMREQSSPGPPSLDRHRRQRCLDDALAGAATEPGPDVADDAEAGGHVLELLGHILADLAHRAAAVGAQASGRVHDVLARQMIREWLAERLGSIASPDDSGWCLGDRFDLGVF